MLVLSRKPQERILIGDNVVITILQVKGRSVRIGIEAPRDLRILRTELSSGDAHEAGEQTAHESHLEPAGELDGQQSEEPLPKPRPPLRPQIGHNRLRRWPMQTPDIMRRHG